MRREDVGGWCELGSDMYPMAMHIQHPVLCCVTTLWHGACGYTHTHAHVRVTSTAEPLHTLLDVDTMTFVLSVFVLTQNVNSTPVNGHETCSLPFL